MSVLPPTSLDELAFESLFTDQLPADPSDQNRPRQVEGAAFSRVTPKPASAPLLVAHSREVADLLGLDEATIQAPGFAEVFSGTRVLDGMDPYAMCYGGHQFGHWAGQLGDGRAINLGEVRGTDGASWTLQLKGAGPTPYSRMADGFAVLRSSVREFLCSEAMHHLGISTTRALSLVTTGDQVVRDMFYDGNPKEEPGAVVCRVARSFVRFGNFEILAARHDEALLKQLADFVIQNQFPELGEPSSATYVAWFEEIARRTAEMVVGWMRVGFVHGVMNTDNMSILGETIDYGPYGWLEDYDPSWTPNTTDAGGRRYAFGNQPAITHWNLVRLASAIAPLVDDPESLRAPLEEYPDVYHGKFRAMMAAKLGFSKLESDEDVAFVDELFEVLQLAETDMTIFFRGLADVAANGEKSEALPEPLRAAYYDERELSPDGRTRVLAWIESYRERLRQGGVADEERRERMNRVNPKYVLRNYLAQLAIDKAESGDNATVSELLEVLRKPYDEQPGKEEFAAKRPDWARTRPGCSMLSCSS